MNRVFLVSPARAAALSLVAALSGCSTIEGMLSGDKVDYKSQSKQSTKSLEVPPDLTQLARDTRYQPQTGVVSANTLQQQAAGGGAPTSAAGPITAAAVAPDAIGDVRIVRDGNQRWLETSLPPDQVWPALRQFWIERGFTLSSDNAQVGIMETDWAENRAKLPNDLIRSTIGRVFDSVYSTGELDRFRTRVERNAKGGSEVYISHRGLQEIYTSDRKESTAWQPRPNDPTLEAEFLSRLMVKLGPNKEEAVARTVVAGATPGPVRARIVSGQPGAAMEVDEGFDRAWRRVGLALDRSGFTVEDRDRSAGLYYVRYVDPKLADKEEPGFFAKIFNWIGSKPEPSQLQRYRLSVKARGDKTQVSVLNGQGNADSGPAAQAIVGRLIDELK